MDAAGDILVLKIVSGPRAGATAEVPAGGSLTLGRDHAADLPLGDGRVSRRHAALEAREGAWRVRDLESSNGTFVNGERVADAVLKAGDLIQVGGTVLEVAVPAAAPAASVPAPAALALSPLAPAAQPPPAVEEQPPRPRRGRRPPRALRRRAAREQAPTTYLLPVSLVLGLGLLALAFALPGRTPPSGTPAEPAAPPERQDAAHDSPVAATNEAAAAVVVSPAAAAVKAVAPLLTVEDFRGALGQLQVLEARFPGHDFGPEKERILEAAAAAADEREREALALARAGNIEGAFRILTTGLADMPEDLQRRLEEAQEEVRKVAGEAVVAAEEARRAEKSAPAAAPAAKRKPRAGRRPAVRLEPRLQPVMAGLEAALDELERAPPAAPEPWEALCARAVKSLEDERGKPGAEALREAVRPLFVEAKSQACRRGRLREVFHVAAASLTEGRLLLRYDFAARDQILDFQPRGAAEAVEHRNRMLVVRGECRLLRGEPFRGRLQLKAKVPAGSYEPRAPNLAIGFFTAEQDRLRVEGGRTASLFGRLAAGGSVPRDHVVLALGYHAQVADYGGRPIYEIHAAGRTDAVRLPAHLVLAGARGKPLHEDARECLWAQPLVEDVRGALAIEAAVEGGAVTWLVGGKAILGERRHVFPELEAPPQPTGEPPPERLGSLTLLAVAGEARFTALEVEGKVNEAWLRSELERAAEAAFAGLFPLPPGEKE